MKRAVSFFAMLAVIGLASPGFAEIQPGRTTLTVLFGGYIFQGDENLKHSPVWNLKIGQDLTKEFSVEAAFDYVPTEKTTTKRDFVDVYQTHLDGLYHFNPDGPIIPYAAAGLGWRAINGWRDSHTGFAFNFGGGVKYFFTDRLAARADIRDFVNVESDETNDNFMYTAGVTYHFTPMKMFKK
jgi:OOP family OmpA-OmpF porin